MYKTKYAILHHSRTYTNIYIGIGSTCMYKCHFNRTPFIKAREAQSVEHQARNIKNFSFVYFGAFDALLAGRLVPYK